MPDAESVRRIAVGIIDADNARDLERVLAFYANDAALFPPFERAVRGKAAIRSRYEPLFDAYQPAIATSVDELRVAGDVAYVIGHNLGRLVPRSGAKARQLDDSYVMILLKSGGTWRIARLMWHASEPHE